MQDAVADVLRERNDLGQDISIGLLLSIILHALLFLPLFVSVKGLSEPVKEPVRVRLAGQQPSEIQRPAVTPPAQVEEPAPPAPPQESVEEPRETPQPETKQVEKSLFGESPEKPIDRKASDDERAAPSKREPQEAIPATPEPAAAAQGISVGSGSAQISGFEGGDFPYTFYVERMLTIIGNNWFRPDVSSLPGATIHFVIERNGEVRDVTITESSGHSAFDRAARRAVIDANPLPPLPLQYVGRDLGVHLKFK